MKTDEELLRDFFQGNELAFAALYNRHKHAIYVYAVKMLGDAEAGKDALQMVFIKLHEQRAPAVENVRAWLFAAVRNHCLNELRRLSRFDGSDRLDTVAGPSIDEVLDRASDAELIRKAIEDLRPEYREVIVLREYEGFSYEEIARITRSTESAVKSRLFKARKRIHEILQPLFMKG